MEESRKLHFKNEAGRTAVPGCRVMDVPKNNIEGRITKVVVPLLYLFTIVGLSPNNLQSQGKVEELSNVFHVQLPLI